MMDHKADLKLWVYLGTAAASNTALHKMQLRRDLILKADTINILI